MVAPTLETRLSSKIRQKSNVINLDRQKTAIKVKFRDSGCVFDGFAVEFTLCFYFNTDKIICQAPNVSFGELHKSGQKFLCDM